MIRSDVWSAVAATFAAIAAWLAWRTQRQSYRHAARPELVLEGWSRETAVHNGVQYDCVKFTRLANVGQGSALTVVINSSSTADDNRPTSGMSTVFLSLVAPGATHDVDGDITIWWNNIAGESGLKHCPIDVDILCWDTTGVRYHTRYSVLAAERSPNVHVANEVAPWVGVPVRRVTQSPVWWLKCRNGLSRLPVIRHWIRDK